MKCIIVEDQPPAQRILQKFIAEIDFLELTGTFSDALQALQYLKTAPVDLLFLDVHLPKISGIDFLEILDNKPQIILTTAFSEYALKGYELDIADYLLKPFSFERFVKAVNKAQQLALTTNTNAIMPEPCDFIFVKSGYEHLKIYFSSIDYIESSADYTEVYTGTSKTLTAISLKNWLSKLPKNNFIQVHKSHIVNTHRIQKIAGNLLYLDTGKQLNIGRAYKEEFNKRFL
ncbi:Transcriptional regulator [Tenacibaculum litopenaei]|jgi:DNA-binding LytR/AlgR family response regulator|uniref:LytR/AlgR family response regulator transcription factor n=1 Tax=Tenacibaculum litopenaei TaxID=396016 RepID=UPI003894F47F